MQPGQAEQRIWLRRQADTNHGRLGFIVELGFPVVYLVLFRNREIALHATLRVEEFNLRPGLDEAIRNLQLRLELPCRDALFLYRQELRQ